MITVKIGRSSLTVDGHAEAAEGAEFAKICNMALMLIYTLLDNVDEDAESGECAWCERELRAGCARLSWDGACLALPVLRLGFARLARDFPQFLRMEVLA